jgi:hypothetical protein
VDRRPDVARREPIKVLVLNSESDSLLRSMSALSCFVRRLPPGGDEARTAERSRRRGLERAGRAQISVPGSVGSNWRDWACAATLG